MMILILIFRLYPKSSLIYSTLEAHLPWGQEVKIAEYFTSNTAWTPHGTKPIHNPPESHLTRNGSHNAQVSMLMGERTRWEVKPRQNVIFHSLLRGPCHCPGICRYQHHGGAKWHDFYGMAFQEGNLWRWCHPASTTHLIHFPICLRSFSYAYESHDFLPPVAPRNAKRRVPQSLIGFLPPSWGAPFPEGGGAYRFDI